MKHRRQTSEAGTASKGKGKDRNKSILSRQRGWMMRVIHLGLGTRNYHTASC
jgi:hypothetical protein